MPDETNGARPTPANRVALLGFSLPAMEALDKIDRPFVAVVPEDFESYMKEHDLPHVLWDFNRHNERSAELAQRLTEVGCELAVPLFEETVEWAGALNGHFRNDHRLFTRYLLFRDKAMMKRRAQMAGMRVGVFEEADDRDGALRFFKRVNKALIRVEGDVADPVHLKPLSAAGCYGHRILRSEEDIHALRDEDFPCLLESHLDGQEFSCEVFVHDKKIRFLNITEYVHLGHSNFVPASERLRGRKDVIRKAVEDLIDAFDIHYGMIHPEFFISPTNKVNFGEVAARVPGGHIFELIQKAYGFDPFAGFAICSDPGTSEEELERFFPSEDDHDGYAGCLMVYPKQRVVTTVEVPDELLKDPSYEKHNLFVPANPKVAERVAYGDHYGTIYFRSNDADEMDRILRKYEDMDYYRSDAPETRQVNA